jgi:hypothetical protein
LYRLIILYIIWESHPFDFHRVLDVLVEKGALPIQKDRKRAKVKKVNGRPTRVYPVDSTKLHPPV